MVESCLPFEHQRGFLFELYSKTQVQELLWSTSDKGYSLSECVCCVCVCVCVCHSKLLSLCKTCAQAIIKNVTAERDLGMGSGNGVWERGLGTRLGFHGVRS